MTEVASPALFWIVPSLLGVGALAFFFVFCRMMTLYFLHPRRPDRKLTDQFWVDCNGGLPDPECSTLRTSDGIQLQVWWFPQATPGPHPTLIGCHGSTSYKEELLNFACQLHAEGCQVVLFDFRGHGESTGHASTLGMEEVEDLRAVMQWVEQHPAVERQDLFLLGHSMGAVTAINYLAHYEDTVKAAFLLAPFATVDRALGNRLRRLPVPTQAAKAVMSQIARQRLGRDLLANTPINVIGSIRDTHLCFIHGASDRGNNPLDSADLFEQARTTKELHWLEGVAHHGIIQEPRAWQIVRHSLAAVRGGTPPNMDTAPALPNYASPALTQKQARPT